MKKQALTILKNPTVLLLVLFACAAFLRFWQLATIREQIFDEVYFPVFAAKYLNGADFYDAHPPLGKLIIAGGIYLFGDNPLGWRFMNACAGLVLAWLVYQFTYSLTQKKAISLLALFLILIDPMALIESRVGLINIYLAVFSIAGSLYFWEWYKHEKFKDIFWAFLFFGAAGAVKWIGFGSLAAAGLFWLVTSIQRKRLTPRFKLSYILLPFLLVAIYAISFIPDFQRGQDIKWWHETAFNYHAHLDATHPYGADWWSWPIVLRPIWLCYKALEQNQIAGIIELGNIITWVSGLLAVLFMLFKTAQKHTPDLIRSRNLFLLLNYFMLYLPWIFIGRVKFIYHYFMPALFLLIILAIVLYDSVLTKKEYRWAGITLLVLATLFFLYFLPLLIGIPVSESFYRSHMWLKSWI